MLGHYKQFARRGRARPAHFQKRRRVARLLSYTGFIDDPAYARL